MQSLPGETHVLQTQMFSNDFGTRSIVTIAMMKRRKASCLIGRRMVRLRLWGRGQRWGTGADHQPFRTTREGYIEVLHAHALRIEDHGNVCLETFQKESAADCSARNGAAEVTISLAGMKCGS
ncbi:hypothetical protein A7X63_06530 [Stenotrophomonas maltophilia]|nr:hypothetical protein L681_03645 [Stenotrophomonas maltophilia MF89]KKF90028.1 hypothetical protein XY58_00795 [Stenotrophomonas maltophilia]KWV47111.1 hypothetical protein AS591_16020 [Stenotrophomonas maltophilia]KXU87240.1 hypothetical protein AB839_19805 [Stenotrophomonas sp. DDT-1]PZS85688.1 hypothetical protein A7X63_06530 [Stenotrophomonas maltophilia]